MMKHSFLLTILTALVMSSTFCSADANEEHYQLVLAKIAELNKLESTPRRKQILDDLIRMKSHLEERLKVTPVDISPLPAFSRNFKIGDKLRIKLWAYKLENAHGRDVSYMNVSGIDFVEVAGCDGQTLITKGGTKYDLDELIDVSPISKSDEQTRTMLVSNRSGKLSVEQVNSYASGGYLTGEIYTQQRGHYVLMAKGWYDTLTKATAVRSVASPEVGRAIKFGTGLVKLFKGRIQAKFPDGSVLVDPTSMTMFGSRVEHDPIVTRQYKLIDELSRCDLLLSKINL